MTLTSGVLDLSIIYDPSFFQEHRIERATVELFQALPGYLCFIKNSDLELVALNERLVDLIEVDDPQMILGMTDYDYLPQHLADAYHKDDLRVLKKGEKVINKVELVTRKGGLVDWSNTTKIPIRNERNEVIGILGVTRPYQTGVMATQANDELGKAIQYMKERYGKSFTIQSLAELTNMSLSSFERKFKQHFNMPPTAYLLKVRIQQACHRLAKTNHTIAQIATECGFSDQSHLTRSFKKIMQETPHRYRSRFRA